MANSRIMLRRRAIARLRRGVRLYDGHRSAPAEIRRLKETGVNAWFEVTLHEGRNQQVRRMFDAIGHSVLKLSRIQIGPLTDSKLKPGDSRLLTPIEVRRLYRVPDPHRNSKQSRRELRVS